MEAIQTLLDDAETTAESLPGTLQKWCESLGKDPVVHDLDTVEKIKLRNGFFTRMVGFDFRDARVVFRPKKAQMDAFYSLFEGDSRQV